jgi:hypothetical protein
MPDISVGLVIDFVSVLCALFAIWKGSAAERAAAVVVMVNIVIGDSGRLLAPGSGDVIRLVNDGLTALALLAITIRFGALWMGGVMLFFAAQFTLHSFYLVTERPNDFLHALINNIDFSGIIICLIIGTVLAWRAHLRAGRAGEATAV